MADGCQNCIPEWISGRRVVYDTTEGFVNPKSANKVRKLQRSIYGLVQASRSWNKCFDSVIAVGNMP